VTHAYNPSYSGGRRIRRISVQSQPQANNSKDSYLEKTLHIKGLVEWLRGQALSSNLSTTKKRKLKFH
jgi:hypothetical protein